MVMNNENDLTTSENLTQVLNGLKGLRKEERTLAFKRVGNLFYNYLKEFNYNYFKKNLLISFFNEEMKIRTRQKIVKQILQELMINNRIAIKTIVSKSKPYLRDVALSCADNESYYFMMLKNGYKIRAFYNWEYDKLNKIPKRVLICKLPIEQEPDFDFDVSEIISHKPISKQGVYSNSQKSRILTRCFNENKIFFVN